MPNHVTTIVSIDASNADEILESLRSDKCDFDFNQIVSKPDCLGEFSPHASIIERAKNACGAPLHNNVLIGEMELSNRTRSITEPCRTEDIQDLVRCILCYAETGFFYWYDWNLHYWGTKWNAYSVSVEGTTVSFDTAWSHPTEIMIALSTRFPDAEFRCTYADEDIGSNCGEVNYQDGHIIHENIAPKFSDMDAKERDDWVLFAMTVKGYTDEEKDDYFNDVTG